MTQPPTALDGKKEACKTYLEQTKLLVTLASAFLLVPAGLLTVLKDKTKLSGAALDWFVIGEVCFIISVLAGYIAVATVTGTQFKDEFNIYRPATRLFSLLQFAGYLAGLIMFFRLALRVIAA